LKGFSLMWCALVKVIYEFPPEGILGNGRKSLFVCLFVCLSPAFPACRFGTVDVPCQLGTAIMRQFRLLELRSIAPFIGALV
jgi:hypothetical protein